MPTRPSKKRPHNKLDPVELARKIVDQATGDAPEGEAEPEQPAKNPAAVALGKLGGSKGGKARAAKLSPAKRKAIAAKAAKARWQKPA
jgi:hypothetical protein